jgi:hypothetical protein
MNRTKLTVIESKHVKSPYTISVPMQIKLCFDRGIQRLQGDKALFLQVVIGNWSLGIILVSVYYNIPCDASSFYSRGGLLFFTILLNALSSSVEVSIDITRWELLRLLDLTSTRSYRCMFRDQS